MNRTCAISERPPTSTFHSLLFSSTKRVLVYVLEERLVERLLSIEDRACRVTYDCPDNQSWCEDMIYINAGRTSDRDV